MVNVYNRRGGSFVHVTSGRFTVDHIRTSSFICNLCTRDGFRLIIFRTANVRRAVKAIYFSVACNFEITTVTRCRILRTKAINYRLRCRCTIKMKGRMFALMIRFVFTGASCYRNQIGERSTFVVNRASFAWANFSMDFSRYDGKTRTGEYFAT